MKPAGGRRGGTPWRRILRNMRREGGPGRDGRGPDAGGNQRVAVRGGAASQQHTMIHVTNRLERDLSSVQCLEWIEPEQHQRS